MIQSGFLSEEDRVTLTALARDGSSPCRVTRRANALVLLDDFTGLSYADVARSRRRRMISDCGTRRTRIKLSTM
jgi:hypothetical protein